MDTRATAGHTTSDLRPGDYVLATKYEDGGSSDHFCVGYLDHIYDHFGERRYVVVGSDGLPFRANGFRRAKKIGRKRGDWLIAHIAEIERGSKSVWGWLRLPMKRREGIVMTKLKELREKRDKLAADYRAAARAAREEELRENETRLRPLWDLAELAHNVLCKHRHPDACSFECETGSSKWEGYAHSKWLRRVAALVEGGPKHSPIEAETIRSILVAIAVVRRDIA